MADNISTSTPDGLVSIGAHEVAGVKYQRVQLVSGAQDQLTSAPLTILDIPTELPDDGGGQPDSVALIADTPVRGYTHASVYLEQDTPFTFGTDEDGPVIPTVGIHAFGSNDEEHWFRVPVIVQGMNGPSVTRETLPELLMSNGTDEFLNIIPIDFAFLRLTIEPATGGPF